MIPLERLLEHRAWVRALARQLVWDAGQVDDIEQQTWLAAVRRPPREGSARAWLGGVVRNLAASLRRTEGRLRRRHAAAFARAAAPATDDVVAQAEQHRRVVDAVLALAEPYRTTLLLRFFEGLAPRQIAERMDAPVETVRARTRRALEQMRRRLDTQSGTRRAWQMALLPLAGLDEASLAAGVLSGSAVLPSATGAVLMSLKSKFVLAAVSLLLLAWFVVRPMWRSEESLTPEPGAAQAANTPSATSEPRLEGAAARPTAPVAGTAQPEPTPSDSSRWLKVARGPGASGSGTATLQARFVDVDGRIWMAGGTGDVVPIPEDLQAPAALWLTDSRGSGSLFVPSRIWPEGQTAVTLDASSRCQVVFTDEQGRTLSHASVLERIQGAGLELQWVAEGVFSQADPLRGRLESSATWTVPAAWSLSGEEFVVSNAPPHGQWRLLVSRPRATPLLLSVPPADATSARQVRIALPEMSVQRVRFVDAQTREALSGATLTPYFEFGDDEVFLPGAALRTDDFGEVDVPTPERGGNTGRPPTWWLETPTHLGRYAAPRNAAALASPQEQEIERRGGVRGIAYLSSGAPATGRLVISTQKGLVFRTRTDQRGSFELPTIHVPRDGRATLLLIESESPWQFIGHPVKAQPGTISEVRLGAPKDAAAMATLAGRVSAGGKGLEGMFVLLRDPGKPADGGKGHFARTDAEGAYRLEGLAPGPAELLVYLGNPKVSDDYTIRPLAVHERPAGGAAALDLAAGAITTVDFDLPAGAIQVTVLDEDDAPVPGVAVLASPMEAELESGRFAGYRLRLGWSGLTDDAGRILLPALSPGASFRLFGGVREQKWEFEQRDVVAAPQEAPTQIVIRRPAVR